MIVYFSQMNRKNIVVIGGGTGTYTILTGLKKYSNLDLSVIVSMMDDGGSNRVIRDEFGLLPTSDIRQCIVALAGDNSNATLRKLFTYRYEQGVGISGMTFGNLFMAALTDIYNGDQKRAIEETCKLLGVRGKIIPVTFDKVHLIATYSNGKQILGEHNIDEPEPEQGKYRIVDIKVVPRAKANKDAIIAIRRADLIILGPGDLYTSIIPNLVVGNIAREIAVASGKILFVMNLMTKFGQTFGFKASDFIGEIEKYVGRQVDYCLINNTSKFHPRLLKKYKLERAELVENNLNNLKIKVIKKNLISSKIYIKPKSDKVVRSLIRHDPNKLARAVVSLINTHL